MQKGREIRGEAHGLTHTFALSSRDLDTPMTDASGIEGSMGEIYLLEVYPEPPGERSVDSCERVTGAASQLLALLGCVCVSV